MLDQPLLLCCSFVYSQLPATAFVCGCLVIAEIAPEQQDATKDGCVVCECFFGQMPRTCFLHNTTYA